MPRSLSLIVYCREGCSIDAVHAYVVGCSMKLSIDAPPDHGLQGSLQGQKGLILLLYQEDMTMTLMRVTACELYTLTVQRFINSLVDSTYTGSGGFYPGFGGYLSTHYFIIGGRDLKGTKAAPKNVLPFSDSKFSD